MGTRVKLAAVALGALVIALVLMLSALMPEPDPPGSVDPIKLRPSPGGAERGKAGTDAVASDRSRRRSRRADRRSGARARQARRSSDPDAPPSSGADRITRVDGAPRGRQPSNDSPAPQPRVGSPAPDRSPAPRSVPVRGNPPAPAPSPPASDAAPAAPEPVDAPDPANDPPGEDPTTASVDPPDQPDPAGADPAGADPVAETP
jgi:hypothetical protein